MVFIEFLKAIFLGIVEGITEWLPISSTGHMILVDEFLSLNISNEFRELFFVAIQIGAIFAVPVLFWDKLWPFTKKKSAEEKKRTYSLWLKVIVGVIPAAAIGFFIDDLIEQKLFNFITVAVSLIVYGVAFLLVERFVKGKDEEESSVYDLSYRDAFLIGCFQVLSLIPGTSRSGSTILGGRLIGTSRTAAAEFSFFMAIPIMLGASGLKIVKFLLAGHTATSLEIFVLLVGIVTSFLVSLVAIRFLSGFVRRHTFIPFGIYRIVLGALVLGTFVIKTLHA